MRPARRATSELPLDSWLFFKLVRMVNLTARPFVERLARTHELSLNEWRVMVALASHPGMAGRDLADITGLDKMSISRAVAGLDRRQRLLKKPDPDDARRTLLWLSPAGTTLFRTIGVHAKARERQLFGNIAAADLQHMERIVDALTAALSEAEQA
jgi:DNA-binding MarR family transcriptional regulator